MLKRAGSEARPLAIGLQPERAACRPRLDLDLTSRGRRADVERPVRAVIDASQRTHQLQPPGITHRHHVEQPVIDQRVRRDHHAAGEGMVVGDRHQRNAPRKTSAIDPHVSSGAWKRMSSFTVCQANRACRQEPLGRRVHRGGDVGRNAETGDVDEMPLPRRRPPEFDQAGIDPATGLSAIRRRSSSNRRQPQRARQIGASPDRHDPDFHLAAALPQPSSPSTTSLTVPSPPAAISRPAPSSAKVRRQLRLARPRGTATVSGPSRCRNALRCRARAAPCDRPPRPD
jgi:hypothetical protein